MKKFYLILKILLILAALIALGYLVTPTDSEVMLKRPWLGESGDTEPAQRLFFQQFDAVIKMRPFTIKALENITGASFARGFSSNEFYQIFNSSAAGFGFEKMELRLPVDSSKDGILVISVNPELAINPSEIMKRFGNNPEISLPAHEAIGRVPVYYVYNNKEEKLSFGFGDGKPKILIKAVIDRIK